MGNQSEDRNKISLKNYKNKSKAQTQEIKAIRKRLVELTISRNGWKQKYKTAKSAICLPTGHCSIALGIRPAGHHYPVALIWLCVQFQLYGGISFRSCRHCLVQIFLMLSLNGRVPSHVSIRTWACKCGYYRLKKLDSSTSKSITTYALIVDESISIGSERLLLVLGLPLSEWTFQRALTLADVVVLSLKIGAEWKAEQVSAVLEQVQKEHKIAYIISDKGNNLVKSYQNSGYIHIPDITHVMAKGIERTYKKDPVFIKMNQICGGLRRRWYLSKSAALMPPSQRKKARFHSILSLAVWANDVLQIYQNLDTTQKKELIWLIENEEFIAEMLQLRQLMSQLSLLLKVEGFNTKTQQQAMSLLDACKTKRALNFRNIMEEYFNDLLQKQQQNHGLLTNLVCCSDVIETAFGKFKYKISPNSIGGMTEFALTIANFGNTFTQDEILKAMESVKCDDLQDWKTQNNVPSLAKKRHDIFQKSERKKQV